ncbi:MAG: beta-lactamase family protein [Anaerolineales bacterium]|nr:beta-lactamase family protein [Anaerolineales bacterium]
MTRPLLLSLSLLVILLTGCLATAKDESQPFPPEVSAELQATMDALTTDGDPPGMVVWIDTPTHRFEGASGSANLRDNLAMAPGGAFRIGSITKMFTATVILQLAEEGKLAVDDPLARWLPEVAAQLPHGDQITLRHLLTHSSGLFNVVEHEAYYADLFAAMESDEAAGRVTLDCLQRDPHDTLARYVYGQAAHFAPGSEWRYSNTNYTLLGMVIEKVTGMALAESYRTHIYEPLVMNATFLDCYEEPTTEIVHGYTGVGDGLTDLTELHESIGWAAGGLVSTAPDLLSFARGLFGGTLFNDPASLDAMTTPGVGGTYGLGLALQEGYWGHAGGIAGFRSLLAYLPDHDTVAVILYNHDGADPEAALSELLTPVRPLRRVEQ